VDLLFDDPGSVLHASSLVNYLVQRCVVDPTAAAAAAVAADDDTLFG
jgi:hypothetical protein